MPLAKRSNKLLPTINSNMVYLPALWEGGNAVVKRVQDSDIEMSNVSQIQLMLRESLPERHSGQSQYNGDSHETG